MVQMLLDGELDAAIVGDKIPDPRLALLIPEADTVAQTWAKTHGGTPINHMIVIRECNFEIATGPRERDLSYVAREPARGAAA